MKLRGRILYRLIKTYLTACTLFLLSISDLQASPWADVGDIQLRHDVEVLGRYGVITGPLNTWPLSWKQISRNLDRVSEMDLPSHVRLSALRVKEKVPGKYRTKFRIQATNQPEIVRGFEKTPRNDLDTEAIAELNTKGGTTLHLDIGFRSGDNSDDVNLDGSYASQDWGNWSIYAGAIDRWWGPGRESTLILSNNARPMPSVGFRRIEAKAFETKWLSWIGPWNLDVFLARQEEERFVPHALILGIRFSFQPIEGFDVGLSRTIQTCGRERPCGFDNWINALIGGGNADNTGTPNEPGNQLASIDLSYTIKVSKTTSLKLFAEGTGEDETAFLPYKYAKLLGFSAFGSLPDNGSHWRTTFEFTDTLAQDAWIFGDRQTNILYSQAIYRTGHRYQGRTIGHSLDADSRLFSVTGEYFTDTGWAYNIKYHNALINRDESIEDFDPFQNRVSINIIEGSVSKQTDFGTIKLEGRYRSDSPNTPDEKDDGFDVGIDWQISF